MVNLNLYWFTLDNPRIMRCPEYSYDLNLPALNKNKSERD